jgi:ferredoxin
MPADDVEIVEGEEEGVIRRNSLGPVEILADGAGRVRAAVFRPCTRVYDENHNFSPQFDDSVRETIECDNVLLSVGQAVDLTFIDPDRDGIELNERGFIVCDPVTGTTSTPGVFVAGDLAYGTKLLIHAVASGKQAARSVYEALTGRRIEHESIELHLASPDYAREPDYEKRSRVPLRAASVADRIRSQAVEVEHGYSESDARAEASRCLDCGVNTIFDGEKCILCGGCVDVCPSLCLRIVSVDRLLGAGEDDDLLSRHIDGLEPTEASAIVKDETICIRCSLCAERCPTGAIAMERFLFKEVPRCLAA